MTCPKIDDFFTVEDEPGSLGVFGDRKQPVLPDIPGTKYHCPDYIGMKSPDGEVTLQLWFRNRTTGIERCFAALEQEAAFLYDEHAERWTKFQCSGQTAFRSLVLQYFTYDLGKNVLWWYY